MLSLSRKALGKVDKQLVSPIIGWEEGLSVAPDSYPLLARPNNSCFVSR